MLPVTLFYAALLIILFVVLSFYTISQRLKHAVPVGDGGHDALLRAIRAHGNFGEYVPLSILMLALVELNNVSPIMLHVLGFSLLVSRLLHAYSLIKEEPATGSIKYRKAAVVLQLSILLVLALTALWRVIGMAG